MGFKKVYTGSNRAELGEMRSNKVKHIQLGSKGVNLVKCGQTGPRRVIGSTRNQIEQSVSFYVCLFGTK